MGGKGEGHITEIKWIIYKNKWTASKQDSFLACFTHNGSNDIFAFLS